MTEKRKEEELSVTSSARIPSPTAEAPHSEGGALELIGLSKAYKGARAVSNVSLSVKGGEFVTLLGPSGSGKTTTLKMIAGFERPDEGSVQVDGSDISRLSPDKRDIGMVFQNYALFPHMSAAENIAFPLQMRRMKRPQIKQKVEAALDLVQLSQYGQRLPSQLSGGQQQRVALARAIVFEPKLVLMDEPLGALDKKLRSDLQVEIVQVTKATGMTAVYVTHDQEEALAMSDRIAIFRDGEIQQYGGPKELYERPSSLFVATFLGDSNVFHGKVRGRARRLLDVGGWSVPIPVSEQQDGSDAALVIRPERVRVEPAVDSAEATSERAALRGVIQEAVYLGSAIKYIIKLVEGQLMTVNVSTGHGVTALPVASHVLVTWPVDDSIVLDNGSAL